MECKEVNKEQENEITEIVLNALAGKYQYIHNVDIYYIDRKFIKRFNYNGRTYTSVNKSDNFKKLSDKSILYDIQEDEYSKNIKYYFDYENGLVDESIYYVFVVSIPNRGNFVIGYDEKLLTDCQAKFGYIGRQEWCSRGKRGISCDQVMYPIEYTGDLKDLTDGKTS